MTLKRGITAHPHSPFPPALYTSNTCTQISRLSIKQNSGMVYRLASVAFIAKFLTMSAPDESRVVSFHPCKLFVRITVLTTSPATPGTGTCLLLFLNFFAFRWLEGTSARARLDEGEVGVWTLVTYVITLERKGGGGVSCLSF